MERKLARFQRSNFEELTEAFEKVNSKQIEFITPFKPLLLWWILLEVLSPLFVKKKYVWNNFKFSSTVELQ